MFWYGLLETFVKEHGHCRVPQRYKTDDGYQLGRWVGVQRRNKDKMDPERRQRLEALPGWSWDVRSDRVGRGLLSSQESLPTVMVIAESLKATRPTTAMDLVMG